ncbi:hypothetical protein KKB68_01785, partial [Patescibacteria group bacterium]|nr:hypothetical protein [Patescibacteria group bacterium]
GRAYRVVKASDENEIAAGTKEGTNKDSADNFRIINEELLKGPAKNWNRIIGILKATVDNGDSNDIQGALQDGTLSGEVIGEALLTAFKRGGPPASRPIAKALYGRLLSNPEQFGKEFRVQKEDDGTTIKRDSDGMPIFISHQAQRNEDGSIKKNEDGTTAFALGLAGRIVNEIPEKLKPGEIAAKILGDTIDYGKADGKEFEAHGGQMVLEQLAMMRGGDLAGSIIRRPETKKGRRKILEVISKMNPRTLYKEGASGLIKYPASSAAQGIGIPSSLSPNETNLLLNLFREEERRTLTTDEERELQDLITKWSIVPTTTKTQSATRPRKSPTPPPGTPSGWVPGPGGMWVPPQKETRSGKRPRRNPGL